MFCFVFCCKWGFFFRLFNFWCFFNCKLSYIFWVFLDCVCECLLVVIVVFVNFLCIGFCCLWFMLLSWVIVLSCLVGCLFFFFCDVVVVVGFCSLLWLVNFVEIWWLIGVWEYLGLGVYLRVLWDGKNFVCGCFCWVRIFL